MSAIAEEDSNCQYTKDDALDYTRREEFTSEIHKIEIRGLPKYFATGQFKRLLTDTLQLGAKKVKPVGKEVCYVTFDTSKDKEKALTILDGFKWKKSTLSTSVASPTPDPLIKRVIRKSDEDTYNVSNIEDDSLPMAEKVAKMVTPFAHIPYEEQLKKKDAMALNVIKKLGSEIARMNPQLSDLVRFQKLRRKGSVCELNPIIPSPVTEGYRNKCEFTIGTNPETNETTIGFRISSYKKGSVSVGPIDGLKNISEKMVKVAKCFEDYVQASGLEPFDPISHNGTWKQLLVRTSSTDECLVAITFHPQKMTESEQQDVKDKLVAYCCDNAEMFGITSFYCVVEGQKESGAEEKFEHLWGTTHITEKLLGKSFRISPQAFFQVNTSACEKLYETVAEYLEIDTTTVLADVCCGTGTIGLCLAEDTFKVYGLEIVEQAVEDARHNAAANDVTNAEYLVGNCEQTLPAIFSCFKGLEVKAVVDPPRAGLPSAVITTLRRHTEVTQVCYVSCDPPKAIQNFYSLTRPVSKQVKGEMFFPIRAIPVDLFPHTDKYELVILFERYDETKWRRIMDLNPRPKDEAYYKRIPPLPGANHREFN